MVAPLRPRFGSVSWLRANERAADAMLALLLTGVALFLHFLDLDTDEYRDPTWWTPLLIIGAILPIAWRRTHTLASTVVVVAVQVVAAVIDIDGAGFLGVVVAIYSLGAHTSGTVRRNAVSGIAGVLLLLFVAGMTTGDVDAGGFISSTIILVASFVVGDNVRRRRDTATSLVERAERAERERDLIAQQRVAAERTRIARELHDVVAHSVSVMVIQSAAARRNLATDPAISESALNAIEETGRQTMNELRNILGVLRTGLDHNGDDSHARLPQPALTDLAALVDANDDLSIELDVTGPIDSLSQSVTLTGFRVVQEALTNIRRHGGRVDVVNVTVRYANHHLSIEVTDDGRGSAADPTSPGFGIVGMQERVAAVGGQLTAAPQPGGGWRVTASIPAPRMSVTA